MFILPPMNRNFMFKCKHESSIVGVYLCLVCFICLFISHVLVVLPTIIDITMLQCMKIDFRNGHSSYILLKKYFY